MIGKHDRQECFAKTYGTSPIIRGGFTYRCQDCHNEWVMWLEKGIEGQDGIMPCPFTIACNCGGYAEHVDWHKDISYCQDEYKTLIVGARYFALDHELGHGRPCVYMGEGGMGTTIRANVIFNRDVSREVKELTGGEYENVCGLGLMGFSFDEAMKLKSIKAENLRPFVVGESESLKGLTTWGKGIVKIKALYEKVLKKICGGGNSGLI